MCEEYDYDREDRNRDANIAFYGVVMPLFAAAILTALGSVVVSGAALVDRFSERAARSTPAATTAATPAVATVSAKPAFTAVKAVPAATTTFVVKPEPMSALEQQNANRMYAYAAQLKGAEQDCNAKSADPKACYTLAIAKIKF